MQRTRSRPRCYPTSGKTTGDGVDVGYGSHLWSLVRAVLRHDGPIVECGVGLYSTPILHELAKAFGRPLLHYESDESWMNTTSATWPGTYTLITSWNDWTPPFENGVIFVDNGPGNNDREPVIKSILRSGFSGVVVLHDYVEIKKRPECVACEPFAFKLIDSVFFPTTLTTSNSIDVARWT